jgi:hypothetical protein
MLEKLNLAAKPSVWDRINTLRISSVDYLAPGMRVRQLATVHDCEGQMVALPDGSTIALDMVLHETLRTNELQGIYYEQGATKAKTAEYSWHFFGLATDNISRAFEWFTGSAAKALWPDETLRERCAYAWFSRMAAIAERNGLKAGLRWRSPDAPHLYFGTLKDTPSDLSRTTYHGAFNRARAGGADDAAAALAGRQAVWRIVGAV